MRRATLLATAAALVLAACDDSPAGPGPVPAASAPQVLRRLATLGFVVANGDDGRGFFDNFFPCMPRGALHYYDTPRGRHVGFRGCDLGGGIVVEGQGELIWQDGTGTRVEFCDYAAPPNCMTEYRWEGRLTVSIDGAPAGAIDSFRVSSVVPLPLDAKFRPRLRSLVASLGELDVPMTDSTLREFYFDTTGFTAGRIPNPSQSLGGLTESDLARLSFGLANDLSWVLLDETLSAGAGTHGHTLSCGTMSVTYDAQSLPTIAYDLTACNLNGVVVQGVFTTTWGELSDAAGRLRLQLAGNVVLGGAVPTVAVTQLTWQAVGITPLPGTATLSLVMQGTGGQRSLTVTIPVDD